LITRFKDEEERLPVFDILGRRQAEAQVESALGGFLDRERVRVVVESDLTREEAQRFAVLVGCDLTRMLGGPAPDTPLLIVALAAEGFARAVALEVFKEAPLGLRLQAGRGEEEPSSGREGECFHDGPSKAVRAGRTMQRLGYRSLCVGRLIGGNGERWGCVTSDELCEAKVRPLHVTISREMS